MCTIYSPIIAPLIYSTLPWPPTPTGKSWGQMSGCVCLPYQDMKLYMKLQRCNAGHDVRGYHFTKLESVARIIIFSLVVKMRPFLNPSYALTILTVAGYGILFIKIFDSQHWLLNLSYLRWSRTSCHDGQSL